MRGMTLTNIAGAVGGALTGLPEGFRDMEIAGVKLDSRKIAPGDLFIATVGERVDGHSFIAEAFRKGAIGAVCEKLPEELPGPCILVPSSFQALEDLAEYYRKGLSVKVVGITGSVGKTSTKEAVAAVLSAKYRVLKTEGNFNNNVGLPLMVLRIREEDEIAVLELGINHFGEMERLSRIARPDIAVITNIGTSHIENLGSREGILAAKSHIFDWLPPDGAIVLNGEDPVLQAYLKELREEDGRENAGPGPGEAPKGSAGPGQDGPEETGKESAGPGQDGPEETGKESAGTEKAVPVYRPEVRTLTFGRKPGNTVFCSAEISKGLNGTEILLEGKEGFFDGKISLHMPLPGPHMVNNALCAALLGRLFGLTGEEIAEGLASLKPMGGRSNIIHAGDLILIDDCYNASPASMHSAIDLLSMAEGRKICILGDMFELGPEEKAMHAEVGTYTAKADPALVICIGELSAHMAEAAKEALGQERVRWYPTLSAFLPEAGSLLQPGDTCLIKASHGMGFDRVVRQLSEQGSPSENAANGGFNGS